MLLYQIAFSLLFEKRNRIALQWLEQYGSAGEAWKHLTEKGMDEAMARAERELAFVETHHISTYWCQDEGYPFHLLQCPDRPLLLFGKGNMRVNEGKIVSVVGTRNATDRGKVSARLGKKGA